MDSFCDNLPAMKTWTATRIRELRKTAGLTQARLADWLGVTRVHVTHLETGFRPAGPQTVRLLDILAERLESGEFKAVSLKPKTNKRRTVV